MRTIKVLRTPEDVLKHKAAKGGDFSESVMEDASVPAPDDLPPPPDDLPPPPDSTSSDSTSSDGPTFEELVEELKDKHKADELEAMAAGLGLDVKGNKTEVATAILKKQLGIEDESE